jgi:uncharacterized Zn-finger protein
MTNFTSDTNVNNLSKTNNLKISSPSIKTCIDFPCQVEGCKKIFKGKGNLKVHMRGHLKDRPFRCENCEKCFSTKGNLKAHSFIHRDHKPFKCAFENCLKRYINECRLKVHERTHIGKKPFKCLGCEKSFNEKGNLKTHMRIHSGERPFVCQISDCSAKFKTSGHLRDHMKIHLDLKPYECQICSKKYSRSCTLKIHQRTHTGEKPFKCPYHGCFKVFSEKGNMKSHFKKHINEKYVNDISTEKNIIDNYNILDSDVSNCNKVNIDSTEGLTEEAKNDFVPTDENKLYLKKSKSLFRNNCISNYFLNININNNSESFDDQGNVSNELSLNHQNDFNSFSFSFEKYMINDEYENKELLTVEFSILNWQ